MNKVFRVIWSEAQGAWVAVSETTKSHSKRSRKHALALALTAGSLIGLSGQALAAGVFVPAGEGSIAINSGTCGTNTQAKGEHSVSIGCGAGVNATGPNGFGLADNDTSIGYQAGLNVVGSNNSAIGTNAGETVKGNNNTAFGVSAGKTITGNKNTSLGDKSGFSIKGDGNLSVGSESGGNVTGDHNVMLGKRATVKGSTAANPISDAVVVGYQASASKSNNVALGFEAKADHENSVALGSLSETRAGESVTEGKISYGTDPDTKTYTYSGFKGTASGVVSVGSENAQRQIINVAPGAITSTSTDAVNGSQLYGVAAGLNKRIDESGGWNVVTSDSSTTVSKVAPGAQVDFVSSDKNVAIKHTSDTDVKTSIDFALSDDLKIGSKDGTDGTIAVNGKDGVSGVTIDGKDGSIGLTGPAGANGTISVTNGVAGLDGKDGTRLVIEGNQVATMNDGLRFSGNDNPIDGYVTRLLNKEMQIIGGGQAKDDSGNTIAYSSGNVRTVATQAGGIEIQFAETPNFKGADMGGQQITSVGSGLGGQALTEITGADLNNAVNVGDLQNTTTGLVNTGFNITADNAALTDPSATQDNVKLGETVAYTGEDGNITTTVKDNQIDFALSNDLKIGVDGKDGTDGKIAVNGTDGVSGVTIDGKDGSIGLTGPAGANGTISVTKGVAGLDGTDGTRLVIDGNEVATMNDGLRFSGNDNPIDGYVTRLLNKEMQIIGGGQAKDDSGNTIAYSSGNVRTVATQAGGIEIQFAETPNFKGADMGGQQITSVGSGLGGQALTEITGADLNNAVNVGDLQNTTTGLVNTGFNITADNAALTDLSATQDNVKLGETVAYTGVDGNITTTVKDNQIDFALSDDLKIGSKDGTDGKIAVNGTDGVSGVTIDGKDGSIGLTGPAGANGTSPTLTMRPDIKPGDVTNDTNSITRITYKDAAGNDATLATLENDGLRFSGNDNTGTIDGYVTRLLNKEMQIIGGGQAEDDSGNTIAYSSGNVRTVATQAGGIEIQFAETPNFKGADMGGQQITSVGSGLGGQALTEITGADLNNAVNVGDLQNTTTGLVNTGFNITAGKAALTDPSATKDNVKLGETVAYTGEDGNITTTVKDNQIDFALSDDLKIGSKDGTGGTIAVNGKDGVPGVTIDGKDGSIGLTGPAGTKGTISVTKGVAGLDGTNGTRLVIEGNQVATMNDGLKFAGNTGATIAKKLNDTLTISGGLAAAGAGQLENASGANLRVDSEDGKLNLVMAKDLIDINSITINNRGPVISQTGIDMKGTKITNLAPGTEGTDAVNVDQLNKINSTANAGWNVASSNTSTDTSNVAPNAQVDFVSSDKNVTIQNTRDTKGNTSLDFALNDDLKIGSKDGTDGKIAVNGKDGVSGVTINGADGSIGLTGKDGTNGTITVAKGQPGVNGQPGETTTRIIYEGAEGPEEVATLNDGLNFAGNTGATIAKKLNETLTISGGLAAAGAGQLENASGANLRVDSEDGKLNLVMAKDLIDINSITINNRGPVISQTGINMSGTKITNLAPGTEGTDAVNVDQLNKINSTANAGWNVASSNTSTDTSNVAPNAQVDFVSSDKNVTIQNTRDTKGNTSLDFALNDDLKIGSKDGTDGKIAVNGKDGVSGVTINGADGSIGLTGKDGTNGTITVAKGQPGVNGQPGETTTRIIYEGAEGPEEVATLNDGLNFAGNTGATIAKKLNETLTISGGLAAAGAGQLENASGANLRVDSEDGKLNLVMAKDLIDINSITINNRGPVISQTGINMSGTKITNLAPGTEGTDAVNVDQLNKINSTANAGFNITADNAALTDPSATEDNVKLGETVAYTGEDGNITTTVKDNQIDFALSDDLKIGSKDGTDGKIAVNGTDGVSGVTIDGKDGSIGLTGPAGAEGISPTLTMRPDIKPGDVTNDTNSITRITYKDADGNDATLATLENDGLRFSGNDNPVAGYVTRNLNQEMQIKGGATIAGSYSSANIKTVATQDGGIEIQFAETPNFKGADMGGQQITSVGSGLGGQAVTEITGADLNNAVNVGDLQNTTTGLVNTGFNITADNAALTDPSATEDNVKLGETVAYTGEDGNITTTVKDNQIDFALSDDLKIGSKDGTDGKIAVNGTDGVSGVTIDGKDGSIGLTGPAGAEGISPTLTMRPDIKPGDVTNNTNSITRITYKDADGNDATLATLENDGLRFSGNDNPVAGYVTRNLNQEMQIKGGATIAGSYSSANIKTVATQDGGIEIQFAETPNFKGADMGGQQITSVGSGLGGQAVTEITGADLNNAVNVGDLQNTTTGLVNTGFNITADNAALTDPSATEDNVKLGETVAYTGEDGNITTTVKDNQIDFALSDDLKIGSKDGTDGKIAVNGTDGVSGVTIDGKDGSIGLTGPAGAEGISPTLTMRPDIKPGDVTNNTNSITRITYKDADGNDATLATLENDGLRFSGNDNPVAGYVTRNLNQEMQIKGGATIAGSYSSANIKTVATQDGGIEIQFAETPNFKGADMGGQQITSVGSGLGGQAVTEITGADLNNAVNVGDLQNTTTGLVNTGFNITADNAALTDPSATEDNVKLGETVAYTGEDGNITTTVKDNQIDFALSDDLKIGSKDGTDGKIAVNGTDGVSGVTIDGKDGSIGLTGPAGAEGISPTLTMRPDIKPGDVTNNTNSITRITYKDADGNDATLATLENDGLRFSGNDNPVAGYVTRNLNQEMQIKGGATIAGSYSSANIKTVATQDGGIEIQIADSPKFGDITINNAGKISGVDAGVDGKDAVNVSQLESVKNVADNANKGWNVSVDGGAEHAEHKVAPGTGVDFNGGKNIELTQSGGKITINTADEVKFNDVKVGDVTINKDAGITVGDVAITTGGIHAGDKKITGVADGIIAADSKDAVNGGQIHDMQVEINKQAGGWELTDGQDGKQQVKAGDTVAIVGGNNINVEFDTDGKMVVETTPDVTHKSVTATDDDGNTSILDGSGLTVGDTVMNDNGVTIKDGPSITKNGVDAGGKKITNVQAGTADADGVNVSQLNETNNRVTVNEGHIKNIQEGKDGMFQVNQDYNAPAPKPTGKKSAAGGAGALASGDNSTAIGNDAQATKSNSTAIGNDAKATASNSTALGNSALASANNSVALGHGSVADRANSVSVGSVGNERQITNVAAGVAPTDAVNVSQLEALGGTVNQYFNAANKRIDKVDNNARAGIAAAMAAGTLPQSTLPGKSMVTVGASTYRGESAIALGVSRLSDNARTVIKANASADSRGNAGAAVGAGWHW